MTIFEILDKKKKRRPSFENSEDYSFFIKNRELLVNVPRFEFLGNIEDNEFDIIRANIVIQSYLNKLFIEKQIDEIAQEYEIEKLEKGRLVNILKEKINDLPYLNLNKNKVYIPIFALPLNIVYSKNPEKLYMYPYTLLRSDYYELIIDLFDVYGPNLFDSYFTRLIKISSNGKETAFLNYDTNTVYIINSQGRLDNKIVLFDKYILKPMCNHMLERLRPLMHAYFSNSKKDFINALHENNFISEKMYVILSKEIVYEKK